MTKNDIFYKVLFAIELALLPLVIYASRITEQWVMCLFVGGVLLVKIWLELFKDRQNYSHSIISTISSVLTFAVLLILFAVKGYLNLALVVASIVLIVIYNILYVAYFKTQMPEYIQAVDYCYMLFECVAIACFVVVSYVNIASIIGLFALIITTVVSIVYKVYYIIKSLTTKIRR